MSRANRNIQMASGGQLSRAEALACTGYRHACHVMLYSDTKSQLFRRTPIRHIILMQMRFDGLLGFPGGIVNPSKESLEEGLSRELLEEIGVAVPISEDDHVESCYAPASPTSSSSSSSSGLILHFYVKKMEEEQILDIERSAASVAVDHGHEVLGMVRVPVYQTKSGGGLPLFLSHSFIGNARLQLVDNLLRFGLIPAKHLLKALRLSMETHKHNAQDLRAALELTKEKLN
ncbi:U8 snoRNA-decapping enzyme isoform X2 [Boleophthalmus pectinirostris]|uniref:U8 snoRNA-decapping enzyme isoform X2 n=1 Tax=Boleophthalmus pectinirostris TaxID=150288 RepID=UPI0024308739|nr:U8 snoRNA-decapping enzyme isoform X2 [Boleophthalmus pectinirostris]